MKEVLETIIKSLVDSPEAIEIKEVENEKTEIENQEVVIEKKKEKLIY